MASRRNDWSLMNRPSFLTHPPPSRPNDPIVQKTQWMWNENLLVLSQLGIVPVGRKSGRFLHGTLAATKLCYPTTTGQKYKLKKKFRCSSCTSLRQKYFLFVQMSAAGTHCHLMTSTPPPCRLSPDHCKSSFPDLCPPPPPHVVTSKVEEGEGGCGSCDSKPQPLDPDSNVFTTRRTLPPGISN